MAYSHHLLHTAMDPEQTVQELEHEIEYLNRQYMITSAERVGLQQTMPPQSVSPYHLKLWKQIKDLNLDLRSRVEYQQVAEGSLIQGYQAERLVGTQNDLIIERLRQHIYEHEIKVVEYKELVNMQKQVVFNLKNRSHLKVELVTENYSQLKKANDILTEEVIQRVRGNQDLEMNLSQLKRQFDISQLPTTLRERRG